MGGGCNGGKYINRRREEKGKRGEKEKGGGKERERKCAERERERECFFLLSRRQIGYLLSCVELLATIGTHYSLLMAPFTSSKSVPSCEMFQIE